MARRSVKRTIEDDKATLDKSISVLATIGDIPYRERTQEQKESLTKARSNVYKAGDRVLKYLLGAHVNEVIFGDNFVGDYEVSLSSRSIKKVDRLLDETQSPEIIADSADSLEKGMLIIYQHLGRVEVAYSVIGPAAEQVADIITKGRRIVKAMHSGSAEWRGDSVSEWWISDNLLTMSLILNKYAKRLKFRYDHLYKSYEIASRLLTVHIESPTGSANYGARQRRKEERKEKNQSKSLADMRKR